MTAAERDIELLREACSRLQQAAMYLGALDRVAAALRHEQAAKEAAIERWRARTERHAPTTTSARRARSRGPRDVAER